MKQFFLELIFILLIFQFIKLENDLTDQSLSYFLNALQYQKQFMEHCMLIVHCLKQMNIIQLGM